jgi:hypothetical protein
VWAAGGLASGNGELGNGTSNDGANATPVTVSSVTSATAIGAGQDNTCAVLAGGGIDCWGAMG